MKINKSVAEAINGDIQTGIYDNFPKLKKQLAYIADKIIRSNYIINADALIATELLALVRNEYISQSEFAELTEAE